MTEPKKFKRGRRTYTRMGQFKEVRIDPKNQPKPEAVAPAPAVPIDMDPALETGVYSNQTTVYRSADEVVLDFGFVPSAPPRGRVRSRVIVSHAHAKKLAKLLKNAVEEID